MDVVIMAGGKGTRIAEINSEVPKPMMRINNIPILEWQINRLKDQGFCRIYLIIGHLGYIIKDYFQNGNQFGVEISYIEEESPLGTAGALYFLKNKIGDDFILLNGDIIFDINFSRMIEFHHKNSAKATILVHPNSHPYDSAVIDMDSHTGRVKKWYNKEDEKDLYFNIVNAGIHILSKSVIQDFSLEKKDLDRDVLKHLIPKGELFAYRSTEYVKDMGIPERYYLIENEVKKNLPKMRNLKYRQRAIFLDRDGTINKLKGFISKKEDFELLPGVAETIKKINQSRYLTIVVTNQPVIARGECSEEELDNIHKKMEMLLGKQGAFIDDLIYCPHHPDSGFIGEVRELKIKCACRKPNPGMLIMMAEKYNIDLEKSYMIGDSLADVGAAKAAGVRPILLVMEMDEVHDYDTAINLEMAVGQILEREER